MRLDSYLVKYDYFESRNRAQEAIKESRVKVDNKIIKKPSFKVGNALSIEVEKSKFYISRAARKLEEYLKEYSLDFKGKRVLDIGSSTGGFTQIALEMGSKSVDCVDVGTDQLHHSLRDRDDVNIYENVDIRDFSALKYDLIISDVSFISLLLIIDKIDNLIKNNGVILLLFKPQFEVGVGIKRDSKGVVIDNYAINYSRNNFLAKCKELGWKLFDNRFSKVSGKEGNVEEFFCFYV